MKKERIIKYEIKDSTRNYWVIVARSFDERTYDDRLLTEETAIWSDGYSTRWHYKIFFNPPKALEDWDYNMKGEAFSSCIDEQYSETPLPEKFMRDFHEAVTGALLRSVDNIIDRYIS